MSTDSTQETDQSLAELLAEHTDKTAEEIRRASEEFYIQPVSEWEISDEE